MSLVVVVEECCSCCDEELSSSKYCEIKLNGTKQIIKLCVDCVITHGISFTEEECVAHKTLFKKRLTKSDKNVLKKQQAILVFKFGPKNHYVYINNIKLIDNGMCYRIEEDRMLSFFFDLQIRV